MTEGELRSLLTGLAPTLRKLSGRIEALEQRVRTAASYRGVHQRAQEYVRGDLVTFQGVLWHCCAETTTSIPGKCSDWQLMEKT